MIENKNYGDGFYYKDTLNNLLLSQIKITDEECAEKNLTRISYDEYMQIRESQIVEIKAKIAAKKAAMEPIRIRKKEINEKKKFLYDTDHEFNKYGEGYYTAEEYQPIKEARQAARDRINELEAEIAQLEK